MNDKDTKNIWIFHHYATPPTMNGMHRPYQFGIHLKEMGHKVKVFSASYLHYSDVNMIKGDDPYIVNEDSEIPHVFVNTPSYSGNGISRIKNMVGYYSRLMKITKRKQVREDRPDVIIASSPHPLAMVAGIRVARKLGIPCICEIRDFWPEVFFMGGKLKPNSLPGRLLLKGEHWIYKNADALIFLKEGDHTYLLDQKWDLAQGGDVDMEKCYYINNGVDLEAFYRQQEHSVLSDPDLDSGKFNVVYTGAIRPVNDVGKILDAAKLLVDYPDIQFLIFGDGNQAGELKRRIRDEEIGNVQMKGYVDKKYIPYILSRSSVNVLNYSQSQYNWSRGNSSNKLFEYMASGKPVLSTVEMGYSPIENYDCGLSLEEDSPEKLAEAVLEFYQMAESRYQEMSENAAAGAKDFDYTKLTSKLTRVIEEVTTRHQ